MIIPARLSQKFAQTEPFVKHAGDSARAAVLGFCEREGYAFSSRYKTVESTAEKIETGRVHRWSDLEDLFACVVIVPDRSKEPDVIKFCEDTFQIEKRLLRGAPRKGPEVFRFDSTRLHARLRPPPGLDLGSSPSIYDVLFEVQVRSAFEHAWSVATHDLAYKGPRVHWKRQRLVAMMKAAVEQLDTVTEGFEHLSESVAENPWPPSRSTRDIAMRFEKLLAAGVVPEQMAPKDLSRFSANVYSLLDQAGKANRIPSALKLLEDDLTSFAPGHVPLSVSLWQYVFGVLIETGFIAEDALAALSQRGFACHLTPEVLSLYPRTSTVSLVFDYAN